MLPLRTFARKLEIGAGKVFSLKANATQIGDSVSVPKSNGLLGNSLRITFLIYWLELGHDRHGDKSWGRLCAKFPLLIFASSVCGSNAVFHVPPGALLLYSQCCRELPDPLVVPRDPQVYKCSGSQRRQ